MPRKTFRTLGVSIAAAVAVSLGAPVASAQSLDELGRPTPELVGSIENAIDQPFIPQDTRETIAQALGFLTGPEEPDEDAPGIPEDGPNIAQFAYPTLMQDCIDGETSVGTATAIPGPAELPLPGVPQHQTGFVFTSLGTGGAAEHQNNPVTVQWFNLSNGRRGETELGFHGVNPTGPGTVNGVADTGSGHVIALMQGGITTELEDGGTDDCSMLPTVGTFFIP